MRNQILASVAMALLGACVGGIDSQPPGGGDDDGSGSGSGSNANARQLFDTNVSPLLTSACASCHVGPELSSTNQFLGADGVSSYYDSLIKDRGVNGGFNPAAATLLLKGAHEGRAWTAAESGKITEWLNAELAARGGTPPDPGQTGNPLTTARGASMAFAGCMKASVTEYNTLKPSQVANINTAQGRCFSCHSPGGAGGQWLGNPNQAAQATLMLAKWQEEVFFTGVFQAQLQAGTAYKIASAETKICNKGQEKANNLGTHPAFDCAQNATALKALKDFAIAVQAKVDAKDPLCAPAAFAPPSP